MAIDIPQTVVINDPGGYVWAHQAMGRLYVERGTKLVVAYCASACVAMVQMVPKDNVCFRASAWIGYHSAEWLAKPDPKPGEDSVLMRWERGLDWIKQGYRECAR